MSMGRDHRNWGYAIRPRIVCSGQQRTAPRAKRELRLQSRLSCCDSFIKTTMTGKGKFQAATCQGLSYPHVAQTSGQNAWSGRLLPCRIEQEANKACQTYWLKVSNLPIAKIFRDEKMSKFNCFWMVAEDRYRRSTHTSFSGSQPSPRFRLIAVAKA
jgi:hypothetical protein